MNAIVIESGSGSSSRRWALIALVFVAQIGLIAALSDRKPVAPGPSAPEIKLRLAADSSELLALRDPTLFALPQPQGFAGAAWLKIPTVPFQPYRWTEPPRLLPLRSEDLGLAFAQFMLTNRFEGVTFETRPAPNLPTPVAPRIGGPPPTGSTLRAADDLAGRRLLNPPELPSWAGADLLTNTVVQVLVDTNGYVMSITLLPPGCGDPKADQLALELARAARFEPRSGAAPALTIGSLIFEWHTVPATNVPIATP